TTHHLTRLAVERLVGDLPSMHIQRHYDFHRDLLELRRTRHRVTTTLETRGSHYMSSLSSTEGIAAGPAAGGRKRVAEVDRRHENDDAGSVRDSLAACCLG